MNKTEIPPIQWKYGNDRQPSGTHMVPKTDPLRESRIVDLNEYPHSRWNDPATDDNIAQQLVMLQDALVGKKVSIRAKTLVGPALQSSSNYFEGDPDMNLTADNVIVDSVNDISFAEKDWNPIFNCTLANGKQVSIGHTRKYVSPEQNIYWESIQQSKDGVTPNKFLIFDPITPAATTKMLEITILE